MSTDLIPRSCFNCGLLVNAQDDDILVLCGGCARTRGYPVPLIGDERARDAEWSYAEKIYNNE
jgi:hypothetical protein